MPSYERDEPRSSSAASESRLAVVVVVGVVMDGVFLAAVRNLLVEDWGNGRVGRGTFRELILLSLSR